MIMPMLAILLSAARVCLMSCEVFVFDSLLTAQERLSLIVWPSDYRTHESSLSFAGRDLHICKEVRQMNKNTCQSVIIRCFIFIIM